MEKLFKLKEHGTNVKTEIIAGITTFLAMSYILAVNPGMLGIIPDGPGPAAIFMHSLLQLLQSVWHFLLITPWLWHQVWDSTHSLLIRFAWEWVTHTK